MKEEWQVRPHRFAPDLELEHFGEESLIFLASTQTFIRVNHAAGLLMDLLHDRFGNDGFSIDDFNELLASNYNLEPRDAVDRCREILAEWTAQGIFVAAEKLPC